jgi:hypothetical protein
MSKTTKKAKADQVSKVEETAKNAATLEVVHRQVDAAEPNSIARLRAALKHPAVQEAVRREADTAARHVRLGPNGSGWKNNEAVKSRFEAWAEFYKALEELI